MNIIAPDPHPGRCLNYRHRGGQVVRCLDYEGTSHVCSFPPVVDVSSSIDRFNSSSSSIGVRPWVKPGDVQR